MKHRIVASLTFGLVAFFGSGARTAPAVAAVSSPAISRARAVSSPPSLRLDSLASPARAGSAEPFLTIGPDGRVYMSWLEPSDGGHALRFAVLNGSTWSAPRTIVTRPDFFVNWADFPSILVLGQNRLAAHWLQRTGSSTYAYGVRLAQSNDGGTTWSAAVTPHRDTAQAEHGFVALWNEQGAIGAVWLDGRKFKKDGHDMSNEMTLMSTSLRADGTLGREVTLDTRTCDCCQNAVALTSNGPIVAYRNRSADEIRDIYVTRRIGGVWRPGVAVHEDQWKIAACPVNGPALVARGARVGLAWFTAAQDTARVNVAFSDDAGATFTTPTRIDDGAPAGRVGMTMLPDGGALVTWVERTGGDGAAVRARRFGRDGRAGVPVTIASSSAARASGFPKVVVTGTQALFAWTVPGKPSNIRIARLALSEFR